MTDLLIKIGIAILTFIAAAVCCIHLLIHPVTHFPWVLGFLAVLAVASLVLLKSASPTIKQYFLITTISLLSTCYLFEVYLEYIKPQAPQMEDFRLDERMKALKKEGYPIDDRTVAEVVRDLRKEGIEAYPAATASMLEKRWTPPPLSGVANARTVYCNESGEYAIYDSDEYGFNNPPGSFGRKADAVILGASFAHGACMQPGKDAAGLLRSRGIQAVNLGGGGNGPLYQLAILKEFAPIIRPSAVIFFYAESQDLRRAAEDAEKPFLTAYLEPGYSRGVAARKQETDVRLKAYLDQLFARQFTPRTQVPSHASESRLLRVIKLMNLRTHLYGRFFPPEPAGLAMYLRVLQEAKRFIRPWGGKVYVVYIPTYTRYKMGKGEDFLDKSRVLKALADAGFPVIDIDKEFLAQNDPLALFPMRRFGHYTETGYAIVADAIASALKANPPQAE